MFIPTAFMPGLTGQFFRQFALTIACSATHLGDQRPDDGPGAGRRLDQAAPRGRAREALPRVAYRRPLRLSPSFWFLAPFVGPRLTVPHCRGNTAEHWRRVGRAWAVCFMPGAIVGWFVGPAGQPRPGLVSSACSTRLRRLRRTATRASSAWRCGSSVIVLVLYVGLLGLTGYGFVTSPTGFIPEQDQGYLLVNVELPDAASVQRTAADHRQLEEIALQDAGREADHVGVAGYSAFFQCDSSNWGTIFVILDDFEKRTTPETQAAAIIAKLNMEYHVKVLGCQAAVFGAPPVPGLGQSRRLPACRSRTAPAWACRRCRRRPRRSCKKANAQPGLAARLHDVHAPTRRSSTSTSTARRPSRWAWRSSDVFNTLNANMGSVYVNQFNEFGRIWQVNIQAEGDFRTNVDDLRAPVRPQPARAAGAARRRCIRVRNDSGPVFVMRYNDLELVGRQRRHQAGLQLRPGDLRDGAAVRREPAATAWATSGPTSATRK